MRKLILIGVLASALYGVSVPARAQDQPTAAALIDQATMEQDRVRSQRLSPADRQRALKLFAQAFDLYQAGDFDASKIGFERGLSIDPANGPANYWLGDILARAKDDDGARARYTRAKFFAPDSAEGLKAEVALSKPPPPPPLPGVSHQRYERPRIPPNGAVLADVHDGINDPLTVVVASSLAGYTTRTEFRTGPLAKNGPIVSKSSPDGLWASEIKNGNSSPLFPKLTSGDPSALFPLSVGKMNDYAFNVGRADVTSSVHTVVETTRRVQGATPTGDELEVFVVKQRMTTTMPSGSPAESERPEREYSPDYGVFLGKDGKVPVWALQP